MTDNSQESSITLSIAGLKVQVSGESLALIAKLRQRYQAFLTAGSSHLTVRLEMEQVPVATPLQAPEIIFGEDRLSVIFPTGSGYINEKFCEATLIVSTSFSIEEIDYFLRVVYAVLAFRSGGLMFHAAGIVRGGQAFLFFGHSGSGKTTVSRLSPGSLILNDDLVLLMPPAPSVQKWSVHATPFWNPSQVQPSCASAPLAAMFHLIQDKQVYLETMSLGHTYAELVASIPILPTDPGRNPRLLEIVSRLLGNVPAYQLHFLPDNSFWKVIEEVVN